MNNKPKVQREWTGPHGGAEAALRFAVDDIDSAAGIWVAEGVVTWMAFHSAWTDSVYGNIKNGICDTVEQAKAAAEQALRDAGYEFEGDAS